VAFYGASMGASLNVEYELQHRGWRRRVTRTVNEPLTLPANGRLLVMIRGANHFTFSDDGALLKSGLLRSILRLFVTSTIEYSKDPSQVGTTFHWTFGLKGDTCDYRVRNDSGRVTSSGRTRRNLSRDVRQGLGLTRGWYWGRTILKMMSGGDRRPW
jgi:hypothetical protein